MNTRRKNEGRKNGYLYCSFFSPLHPLFFPLFLFCFVFVFGFGFLDISLSEINVHGGGEDFEVISCLIRLLKDCFAVNQKSSNFVKACDGHEVDLLVAFHFEAGEFLYDLLETPLHGNTHGGPSPVVQLLLNGTSCPLERTLEILVPLRVGWVAVDVKGGFCQLLPKRKCPQVLQNTRDAEHVGVMTPTSHGPKEVHDAVRSLDALVLEAVAPVMPVVGRTLVPCRAGDRPEGPVNEPPAPTLLGLRHPQGVSNSFGKAVEIFLGVFSINVQQMTKIFLNVKEGGAIK